MRDCADAGAGTGARLLSVHMNDDRRWAAALEEHEFEVSAFVAACAQIEPLLWQRAPAPKKWSPAAVALHISRAYELGRAAVEGGPSMRLLVSPSVAWLSRMLILPVLLATRRFPQGVRAPREVVPDAVEAAALTQAAAAERIAGGASAAAIALRRAANAQPTPQITHAYFGTLTPHAALRLLSAHTRHHTRQLRAWPPPLAARASG